MGLHRNPDDVPQQFDDSVHGHGPQPLRGWVDGEVAERLPDLELLCVDAPVAVTSRSPEWAKERLRYLSSRVRGQDVLQMHGAEAASAYRQLYRDVGRDPDRDPPPMEAAYVERLARGGFPQVGIPSDALMIVLLETGIPIWAVDAELIDGPLGIRRGRPGETPMPAGADQGPAGGPLVVADNHGVVADLGREPRALRAIDRRTTHALFFSVKPAGVSELRVREAFWMCMALVAP